MKEPMPLQPIEKDATGTWRFRKNQLVVYLLENGPFDMNKLALVDVPQEDREQFAQLIGYSVSGLSELPYISDATWDRVSDRMVEVEEGGDD